VKVLVDECVPLKLVRLLTSHNFSTRSKKAGMVSAMENFSRKPSRNLICS